MINIKQISTLFFFILPVILFSQDTLDSLIKKINADTITNDSLNLLNNSNIDSLAKTERTTIDTTKTDFEPEYVNIKGKVYPVLIQDGDTMVLATIEDVSLTSPRSFDNVDDYRKYLRYKAYAAKVYPYAVEAIKIFRQTEYVTQNMKKRKRKKHIKKLQENLKTEFEEPLGNLTKMQGKILVKMIERELEVPMYDLIKGLRGKFRAFYWNQFSKLYGYRLKTGYIEGENSILDAVIQDLNVSYEIDPADYEHLKD